MKLVKRTILGISAFALVLSPATIFLNDSKNHIIQNISDNVISAMDDTSLIFRKEMVANSHNMNVASVGSEFDNMKLSDVSAINSSQTVASHNQTIYDYNQATNYLKTNVDNTAGFMHVDPNTKDEAIFSILSKAMQTVKSSFNQSEDANKYFDAQQGINPSGMNELLNMVSYGVTMFADKIDTKSIDASLTSINSLIAPFVDFILPPIPTSNVLTEDYDIYDYQEMHNYLITRAAYFIIDFLNPDYIEKVSFFSDEVDPESELYRKDYDWSNPNWLSNMYNAIYDATSNFFNKMDINDLIQNKDLGIQSFDADADESIIASQILDEITFWAMDENGLLTNETANASEAAAIRDNLKVESINKISPFNYVATIIPTSTYKGEAKVNFTTGDIELININPAASTSTSWINELMEYLYILSWYMNKFELERNHESNFIPKDDDHLFTNNKTNIEFITSVKAQQVNYIPDLIEDNALMGVFNMLKGVLLGDSDSMGYTRRALKILFQFEDGTAPSFDNKTELNLSKFIPPKMQITGNWSNAEKTKVVQNGFINILYPLLESLVNSNYIQNIVPDKFINYIDFNNVGFTAASIVASILADNDLTNYFGNINLGWLEDLFGLIGWIPSLKELVDPINSILSAIKDTANKGAFKNMVTQILTLNLKTQFLPQFNSLITLLGLEDVIPSIPNINIRQIMDSNLFGSFTIGSFVWTILTNYKSLISQFSVIIDLFRSTTSNSAISTGQFEFYNQATGETIEPKDVLGYDINSEHAGSNISLVLNMIKSASAGNTIGIVDVFNNASLAPTYGANAWKQILGLNANDSIIIGGTLIDTFDNFNQSLLGSIITETIVNYFDNKINSNLDVLQYDRKKLVTYRTKNTLYTNELVSHIENEVGETLQYNIHYKISATLTNTYNVQVFRSETTTDNKWQIQNFSIVN